MGDETYTEERFSVGPATENPGPASYGVFSGSQHFTVAGGTFTNITNNHAAPNPPSDFRRVPIGDIDLQREIRLDSNSGVVTARTRRYHSAKIDRGTSSVTVAMYRGEKAEEDWQRDVAKYMAVRHPNIVQLWGTASSGNTYATIFHDDLIPFYDFLGLYQHSHFATVYIYAYADAEFQVCLPTLLSYMLRPFQAARDYFNSIFSYKLARAICTPFIRCSSGRFCVDLFDSGWVDKVWQDKTVYRQGLALLSTPNLESTVLDSMTTPQYHEICHWELAHHSRYNLRYWEPSQRQDILMTALENVKPGVIIFCPSKNPLWDVVDIEIGTVAREINYGIGTWDAYGGNIMEERWLRVTSDHVMKHPICFGTGCSPDTAWLSQANHVFSRLGITSNFEDYVRMSYIGVRITVSPIIPHPPEGYLFVCPAEQLYIGPSLPSKWPECPAYWSLHPSGAERLSWEDAASLGFPRIGILEYAVGRSWDARVYEGLRQFHQTKGFDPDSQELALHLGEPLYKLSSQTNTSFACFHEEDSNGEDPIRAPTDSDDESEDILELTHPNGGNISLDDDSGPPRLAEEAPVSSTFKFVLSMQLTLILFHMLLWLVGPA